MECWDSNDLIPLAAVPLLFLRGIANQREGHHWWATEDKESNVGKWAGFSKETMGWLSMSMDVSRVNVIDWPTPESIEPMWRKINSGESMQSRHTDVELPARNILEPSGADRCIFYRWMKSCGDNVRLYTMETKGIRNFSCFLPMQCHVPVVAEKIRPITPNKISKPFSGPLAKMLWCWMFYIHLSFSSSQTSFPVWSTFVSEATFSPDKMDEQQSQLKPAKHGHAVIKSLLITAVFQHQTFKKN